MKITTKGRYALWMMLDIAQYSDIHPVSLAEISEREGISRKYLEQIAPKLTGAGLLKTTRGARGGYVLAKRPEDISVGDIVRPTEGSLIPVLCIDGEAGDKCMKKPECVTIEVWEGLYHTVTKYLDSIDIKSLMERQERIETLSRRKNGKG